MAIEEIGTSFKLSWINVQDANSSGSNPLAVLALFVTVISTGITATVQKALLTQ